MHFFVDFWKDKEARVIFVRELHCALGIVRELRGALSKSVHCLPPSCSGTITEKLKARGTALIDVFPRSVGGERWGGVTVYCDGSCKGHAVPPGLTAATQPRAPNRWSKCGVAHFFGTYVSSQITAVEPGRRSSRMCHLSGYNIRRNFSKHKSPGTQQLWNDLGNTKTHLEATLIESSDPGSYPGFLVTQTNVLSL